ncbi:hypothetical protein PQX77_017766 [Marasmius sp. AFHP31]|nr:hypothetical protein PQX77_017766 [Marasmius sp. AFHP31]
MCPPQHRSAGFRCLSYDDDDDLAIHPTVKPTAPLADIWQSTIPTPTQQFRLDQVQDDYTENQRCSSLRGSVRTQNTAEVSISSAVGASHKTAQHSAPNLELDSLYHLILTSSPDPNENLTQILAAILILPSAYLSPSPVPRVGFRPKSMRYYERYIRCWIFVGGRMRFGFNVPPSRIICSTGRGLGGFISSCLLRNMELRESGFGVSLVVGLGRTEAFSYVCVHSADQLENDTIKGFLTGWTGFCASLPIPTTDLPSVLRNINLAPLFFCKYRYRAQDTAERETVDRDRQDLFGALVSWVAIEAEDLQVQDVVGRLSNVPEI